MNKTNLLLCASSVDAKGKLYEVVLNENIFAGCVQSWVVRMDDFRRNRHISLKYDTLEGSLGFYYACIKDCFIDEKRHSITQARALE